MWFFEVLGTTVIRVWLGGTLDGLEVVLRGGSDVGGVVFLNNSGLEKLIRRSSPRSQ